MAAEDGPWDVLVKLRQRLGNRMLGRLIDCPKCLSLWVAGPFACWLGSGWQEHLVLWLGISGAVVVLHKFDAWLKPPPAAFVEGPMEQNDGMLRR